MTALPWLSIVTFAPLVGLLVVLLTDGRRVETIRGIGVAFSLLSFILSVAVTAVYMTVADGGFQLIEDHTWIAGLGVRYQLGVDGISVPMVFLTGLLAFIAALASWNIKSRAKEYWIFYLLLQVGMFGTFVAIDLFVFYVFWEIVLVPMYFLIGIWGGPRRRYAAIKFFLYTMTGSVFMLIGFLALHFASGTGSFSIPELVETAGALPRTFQILVFLALFLGFAVKVPAFPFHTWLPDAHVEAPTPISVILAGVLLKMGTYGFFRVSHPLCPQGAHFWAPMLAIIGVIAIVYTAYVAMAQRDFKKLVAYSSVSHMGFVMLGLATFNLTAMSGAYFMTFSHGLLSAAMFLLVGVIYDRTHTRNLDEFGGLFLRMPLYGMLLIVLALGAMGLPGMSGFIAELYVLLGALSTHTALVIISLMGMLITVAFTLLVLRRVLLGPLNEKWAKITEINGRELLTLVPLAVLTILFGILPWLLTNVTDPSLTRMLSVLGVEVSAP